MIFLTKLLCLVLSAGLLYHVYVIRKHSGTWLTPAGIWSIIWFMFTFIPLLAAPSAPVNPLAILYILVASVVFSLPAFTTRWQAIGAGAQFDSADLYRTKFLQLSFYAVSAVAVISVALNLAAQGVSIDRLMSDFLSVTSDLIVDRYTESTIESVFAQISNIFTYCSAAIGGLVFFGAKTSRAKILIIASAMTPSLALMAIAGAKGTIFLCISIFYGSMLAARARLGGNQIIDKRTIIGSLIALACLLPFVLVSFLARGISGPGNTMDLSDALYRLFISYSSAHIYAFSDWFSWYIGQESSLNFASEDITGGFYTFMSIFKLLGSTKVVPPGYYGEYFQYSWFLQTNIYTVFRGLVTDFSLIGSIVFMYVAGFAANLIFISLMRAKSASWSIALYSLFCGLVYTSFLISVFVWNSMYPVFAIVGVVLKINSERAAAKIRRQPVVGFAPNVAGNLVSLRNGMEA